MTDKHPTAESDDPENNALSTSDVLAELADTGDGDTIALHDILDRFHSRAYGVLLILVLIPAFIPLPVGTGGISGSLATAVGLQMLLMLRRPWLPRRALNYQIRRSMLKRFAGRMHRLLGRLERACRPRLIWLTQGKSAHIFSGVQIVLLGILLALPIPLTNYLYAVLLLLYAIAIIERDGVLLLLAWTAGTAAIVASVMLSGELVDLVRNFLA